jgi:hypothetical protein
MDAGLEHHVYGVLLGFGSIALGYLLSRVTKGIDSELEYLKSAPRYYNFTKLQSDLSKKPSGVHSRVLVEGTVRKDGNTVLFSDDAGLEGAARLVLTTSLRKVWNEEKSQWNERSDNLTNQCLSIPFKLVDRQGASLTIENIHLASGFRSILQRVYQKKTVPENRSIGDYATGVTINEIHMGTKIQEHMLLYGTTIAALGDAMEFSVGDGTSKIIFHPDEVSSSIKSMITEREMISSATKVVSAIFLIGGISLVVIIGLGYVFKKRRRSNYINS